MKYQKKVIIFNKLVRDKIPQMLIGLGKKPTSYIADEKEYWQRLKNKLHEEVEEFCQDETIEELADILEVVYAICKFKNFDKKQLEKCRQEKFLKRGGFKDKIVLDKVE